MSNSTVIGVVDDHVSNNQHDPNEPMLQQKDDAVDGCRDCGDNDASNIHRSMFKFKPKVLQSSGSKVYVHCKEEDDDDQSILVIHPETLRILGYSMFLVMLIAAYILTEWVLKIDLSHSPLVQHLGYNNVCAYFDFTFAREIAAMLYIFGELPYCGYIFLNWIRYKKAVKLGYVSSTEMKLFTISFIIELILVAWFRMVFVVKITDSIYYHTLAFVGLQIGLILNALHSFTYYYKIIDFTPSQLKVSLIYILSLVFVTLIKNIFTQSALLGFPVLDYKDPSQVFIAKAFDDLWLLLGFVMPPFIAWKFRVESPRLVFFF